jgi:hypothetical protein
MVTCTGSEEVMIACAVDIVIESNVLCSCFEENARGRKRCYFAILRERQWSFCPHIVNMSVNQTWSTDSVPTLVVVVLGFDVIKSCIVTEYLFI